MLFVLLRKGFASVTSLAFVLNMLFRSCIRQHTPSKKKSQKWQFYSRTIGCNDQIRLILIGKGARKEIFRQEDRGEGREGQIEREERRGGHERDALCKHSPRNNTHYYKHFQTTITTC